MSGLLVVVGTGIKAIGHMTLDARAWIGSADEVHYVTTDPITEASIRELQPNASSLSRFYEIGRARHDTYEAMTQALLAGVRAGRTVCAAFYGHPGVFVYPSHDAIRRARAEGMRAIKRSGASVFYADARSWSRGSPRKTACSPTSGSIPRSSGARSTRRPTS